MKIDNHGFHFEEARRSGTQGAVDPAQQYFEGSSAGASLMRETGQNSLDARWSASDDPVHMTFELATVDTDDIPDIERLRQHLDAVVSATDGQQGHDRMRRAATLARAERVPVLRISDRGTTGLTGSESVEDSDSPLSALTRGAGTSSTDATRGGSFGIGSAVGPMASDLCTVLYRSLPVGSDETVLAGYSRLASHKAPDGTWLRGEGFLTRLDSDDFVYVRPAPDLGPFADRTEPGTDIFVLGYRMADDDPLLHDIRDAAVDNFMVAIDRQRLVVEGITHGDHWVLDHTTLEGFAKRRSEPHAFLRALRDPEPTDYVSEDLGRVTLHVHLDDSLPKKLHTATMRAPLMRIGTFTHRSISAKYAAILICEDEKGNRLLRELEPPEHTKWDPGRADYGPRIRRELMTFVRRDLQDRVRATIGDRVEIKGLARFLPSDTVDIDLAGDPAVPRSGGGVADESSSVVGDPVAGDSPDARTRRTTPIGVRGAAVSTADGEQDIEKGKDRGGKGKRKRGGRRGLDGKGEPADEGGSRIRAGQVRFRSWASPPSGETTTVTVLLEAAENASGDLELEPLGPGGRPEEDYVLPIAAARIDDGMTTRDVAWDGNVIKDLSLGSGEPVRLQIDLPAGRRFRLGVAS